MSEKAMTDEELRSGVWYVYEEYEVLGELGEAGRYVKARPAFLDATGRPTPWRWDYEPLIKHEDLFLTFARWPEERKMDGGDERSLDTDKNAAIAWEWAETYGVLGLTLRRAPGSHSWWANPAGGEGDTVAAFAREAWAANRVLRLYEAATRSEAGGVDVETIISLTSDPVHKDSLERFPDEARGFALSTVAHEVKDRQSYYFPALYRERTPDLLLEPGGFVEGYGFTNLLGAIWLQALWLLTAGPESVTHCAYCNRIVVYEQPEKPSDHKKGERKPYKTRSDKKHCDNTCVQRKRRMNQRLHRPGGSQ